MNQGDNPKSSDPETEQDFEDYFGEYEEPNLEYCDPKTVLTGTFSLSDKAVPFYVVNLRLDELVREVKLVEDIETDYRSSWTLEELFQREIDYKRVAEELLNNYLLQKEKRTFFNALTVALLPTDENGRLTNTYRDPDTPPARKGPFGDDKFETMNIGGVQTCDASRQTRQSDIFGGIATQYRRS